MKLENTQIMNSFKVRAALYKYKGWRSTQEGGYNSLKLTPILKGGDSPAPYRWFIGSPHLFGFTSVIWGVVRGARTPPGAYHPGIPGSSISFLQGL